MTSDVIGTVVSGQKKSTYDVKWNGTTVYVRSHSGFMPNVWSSTGRRAGSAGEAMRIAEAFVYDK